MTATPIWVMKAIAASSASERSSPRPSAAARAARESTSPAISLGSVGDGPAAEATISGVPKPTDPGAGRPPTIAVIGSHGVRKSTAVAGIAAACERLGLRVGTLGEVIRTSPLGHNETATPAAQLWVIATQVAREIEAGSDVEVLVTDRSVVDNYAYYRRAAAGRRATPATSGCCRTCRSSAMASAAPRLRSATRSKRCSIGSCRTSCHRNGS